MATVLTDRLSTAGKINQKSVIEFEFASQLILGPPLGDDGRVLRGAVLDLCSSPGESAF